MTRSEEHDRRYTRAIAWGIGLSAVGHAALFLIFSARPLPISPFAAAGERMGDIRAAAGGGMEAIQLRPPTEVLQPPPPVPAPTPDVTEIEPPEPELEEEEIPAIALAEELATSGTEGPAEGPGLAAGEGQGDGGTEAEGRFRVVPPSPTFLGIPPTEDRPDEVRGRELVIWVYVTASGDVVPDSTRVDPRIRDRGFDRRIRDYASSWRFKPARNPDGLPVGEWFRWSLEM
jgi:hypothetical protein